MARKTDTREIDGVTYQVTQLGAIKARHIVLLLLRAAGPAMAEVVSSDLMSHGAAMWKGDKTPERIAAVGTGIAKGFGSIAQHMREEDLDALCEAFQDGTHILHKATSGAVVPAPLKGQFDDHFAGRMVAMMGWLVFCVQVNFGNFSDLLTQGMKQSPSEEPPEKTPAS